MTDRACRSASRRTREHERHETLEIRGPSRAWTGDRPGTSLAIALGGLAAWCGSLLAADERAGIEFFESKIRPVLVERCQKCHSAELAKPKGQLRLDTREATRRGGTSGPAVVPGDVEASTLYQAIAATDGYSPMPPKEKLPAPVIADFRRWIEMGAPDPRDGAGTKVKASGDGRDWWSLRPLARPNVPTIPLPWPAGAGRRSIISSPRDWPRRACIRPPRPTGGR